MSLRTEYNVPQNHIHFPADREGQTRGKDRVLSRNDTVRSCQRYVRSGEMDDSPCHITSFETHCGRKRRHVITVLTP